MDLYIQVYARRLLPSAVPWISEDRLLSYYHRPISEINGYDFNDCNNVRDILYNTDIIISVVKLIVYSPVGKLV